MQVCTDLTDLNKGIIAYVNADWGLQWHCHSISDHVVSLGYAGWLGIEETVDCHTVINRSWIHHYDECIKGYHSASKPSCWDLHSSPQPNSSSLWQPRCHCTHVQQQVSPTNKMYRHLLSLHLRSCWRWHYFTYILSLTKTLPHLRLLKLVDLLRLALTWEGVLEFRLLVTSLPTHVFLVTFNLVPMVHIFFLADIYLRFFLPPMYLSLHSIIETEMSFSSLNIWSPYLCVPSHSSVRYLQMSLCSIIETEPLFCYTCLLLLLPCLQYSGHVGMTHCVIIIIIIPSCCLHHFCIVLVLSWCHQWSNVVPQPSMLVMMMCAIVIILEFMHWGNTMGCWVQTRSKHDDYSRYTYWIFIL